MQRTLRTLLSTPGLGIYPKRCKYSKIKPVMDVKYLLNPDNVPEIAENTTLRKGVGDIHQVHQQLAKDGQRDRISPELESLLLKIPNKSHPEVRYLGDEPRVIRHYNDKPVFEFQSHQFQEIAHKNKWFRMEHLSNFTGHKSYYLMGDLAALVSVFWRFWSCTSSNPSLFRNTRWSSTQSIDSRLRNSS